MVIKAVVHVPTGAFKNAQGDFACAPNEPQRPVLSVTNGVTTYDPNYDVVVVPRMPDPRTEKYDSSAAFVDYCIVSKSQAEIAAYDATALSVRSQITSRQKDILTMCALVVRARGINAWNNMTTPQKVTATLAEADVWKTIREFIDDKV